VEYLDYSWGIWSGCRNLETGICPVKACWAKGIVNHYPKLYPNGFNPTYYPEAIDSPKHLRKPSIISVGWVGDVIGYGIEHKDEIFETIRQCPQHKFLFLTKNPDRLINWGEFPDNAWVGVTVCNQEMVNKSIPTLMNIEAKVRYVSIEPMLEPVNLTKIEFGRYLPDDKPYLINAFEDRYIFGDEGDIELRKIDLVMLGAQSKPTVYPEIGWVQTIALACTKADIPLFLKDNLKPLLPHRMPFYGTYIWKEMSNGAMITMSENRFRQELPDWDKEYV